MKKILPFACIFLIKLSCAQTINTQTSTYFFPENDATNNVIITMPFGKTAIQGISGDTALLKNAGEIIIDIVYSDYPSTLSLKELNKGRLLEFRNLFPEIKDVQIKSINFIRQMDGNTKEVAEGMYHGIVLHYRPKQTKETMQHDISELDKILKLGRTTNDTTKKNDSSFKKEKIQKVAIANKQNIDSIKKASVPEITEKVLKKRALGSSVWIDGYRLDTNWLKVYGHSLDCIARLTPKEALKQHYITKEDYHGNRKIKGFKTLSYVNIFICNGHPITDTLAILEKSYPIKMDSTSITEYSKKMKELPDSTIFKIFKRNRWINMDITGDVTGSMYPYTAQLLLWLKLQSLDSFTNIYSFFNDGDDLPDRKKKIGKTGGIYSKRCNSFTEVVDLVKKTMMNGGGGDCPENNIEALIQSEKLFPEVTHHVLIADNWANIKDTKLIDMITKPVRVVLCAVYNYNVNVDYLNLARKTKGSLHLMEEDIINLSSLHEGEVIQIGNRKFKIINGLFNDITEGSIKNNYPKV